MRPLVATALFCGLSALPMTASSQAGDNLLIGKVVEIGTSKVCGLQDVPKNDQGRADPTTQHHRMTLYLRCELKGGRDEYASESCCDHLRPEDGRLGPTFRVCPDEPPNVVVPARNAVRTAFRC